MAAEAELQEESEAVIEARKRTARFPHAMAAWAQELGMQRREGACVCWLRNRNCRNECEPGGIWDHATGWMEVGAGRGRSRERQAVLVTFPYWSVEDVEAEIERLELRDEFRVVVEPPPGLWHPLTCRVEFWRR